MTVPLIRFALLLIVILFVALMVALHGVRALALLAVFAVIWAIATTRVWRGTIGFLTRATGSRRNAYATLGFVLIALVAAFSIYQAANP